MASNSRRTLGIFAKQPLPGRTKTRLAAATSPEWAAEVAEALLLDWLDRLAAVEFRRVLVFDPPEAASYFAEIGRQRFELRPQASGDLGTRLAEFFESEFDSGAECVVAVGTDSPTLPIGFIHQAFDELRGADVMLGPAMDGGYYLIGYSRSFPDLFYGIAWGTSGVLRETVNKAASHSLKVALLPPWYDVDTIDDWHFLCGHVAAMRAAGIERHVPRTEAIIARCEPRRPKDAPAGAGD